MGLEPSRRLLCSDSLVGSLCREADRLRQRCSCLAGALERCLDPTLRARLSAELAQLQRRRSELHRLARSWQRQRGLDPLLVAFLAELSGRKVHCSVGEPG